MPLYEYRCTKCNERVEVIQKFSDRLKTKCASCGGKLEKLLSAGGFVLKGSGWYKSDYSPKPKAGGTSGKEGEATSGASEATSDVASEASKAASDASPSADSSEKGEGATKPATTAKKKEKSRGSAKD